MEKLSRSKLAKVLAIVATMAAGTPAFANSESMESDSPEAGEQKIEKGTQDLAAQTPASNPHNVATVDAKQREDGLRGINTQSRPELTLKNFDEIMQSKEVVVIEVRTPWCGPCKNFSETLDKLDGIVGKQVKVMNLTVTDNPESDDILRKLGSPEIENYPTTLIRGQDGTMNLIHGDVPLSDTLDKLAKVGVRASRSQYKEVLKKENSTVDNAFIIAPSVGLMKFESKQIGLNENMGKIDLKGIYSRKGLLLSQEIQAGFDEKSHIFGLGLGIGMRSKFKFGLMGTVNLGYSHLSNPAESKNNYNGLYAGLNLSALIELPNDWVLLPSVGISGAEAAPDGKGWVGGYQTGIGLGRIIGY